MKRRLVRIAILAGGGLVLLGITLTVIILHKGPGALQDWIGSQLQDIANSYLNPKLSFTDLAYEYPLTVSLKNLHLTADDPAHSGAHDRHHRLCMRKCRWRRYRRSASRS